MTIDESTARFWYQRFENGLFGAGFSSRLQKLWGEPYSIDPKEVISPPIEIEYSLVKRYAMTDQVEAVEALKEGKPVSASIESRAMVPLVISVFTHAGRQEDTLGAGISFELVHDEAEPQFCVNYNFFPTAKEDPSITGPLNAAFSTFKSGEHYHPDQVIGTILSYMTSHCLRPVR